MKYIKGLNIDFNNWNDYDNVDEFNIGDKVRAKYYQTYLYPKLSCSETRLKYSKDYYEKCSFLFDKEFTVTDICYNDFIKINGYSVWFENKSFEKI